MGQLPLPGMELPTDYHDFTQRLIYANVHSSPMRLEWFYRRSFPNIHAIVKVDDLELQRQGIDTILYLTNGKPVYFDEKIREKTYPDILIEEFSVWPNYPSLNGREIDSHEPIPRGWRGVLKPGWIGGHKVTDYVAYVKRRANAVYFLPFLLLQSAWLRWYKKWIKEYGRKPAPNRTYTTTNVPIPNDVLYQAIYAERTWL